MKKLLVLFFSLILLLVLSALAETSGDFSYRLLEDGTAEITAYNGNSETLNIPAELDGVSVTKIGDKAFSYCRSLTSVTIPDSVTSIGDGAFSSCNGLTSVTLPDSVTEMGANPFTLCAKLTEITASPKHEYLVVYDGMLLSRPDKRLVYCPQTKTGEYAMPRGIQIIGDGAFYGCDGLTSVTICGSVTEIGDSAFSGCSRLRSVDIPYGVKKIGDRAFYGCSNLIWATIPNSVTSLGSYAFAFCDITLAGISDNTTEIGANPFVGCSKLTKIAVGTEHKYFAEIDGALFSKPDRRLISCPASKTGKYAIPWEVQIIGDSAFSRCVGLTSVTIHDRVTEIGKEAFSGCVGLTSVTIPGSVTSIGDSAFAGCVGLTSVTIPDSVTDIGKETFIGCSCLTSVSIPGSVTKIGDGAFALCFGLTSVTVPGNVTSIGERAFALCFGLTSVTIPAGVTEIGDSAFADCAEWLTLSVEKDSYAASYCKDNALNYKVN